MRLAWLTDIHLDHVGDRSYDKFITSVNDTHADAVLIGGDISNANDLREDLKYLATDIDAPVYYVLGNHDFYWGAFASVRKMAESVSVPVYLPSVDYIDIAPNTRLIGVDGWADTRAGDYDQSDVILNDYSLILDFEGKTKEQRQRLMMQESYVSTIYARDLLLCALREVDNVILLTHVPPFPEAAWHLGHMSDPHYLPHFCNAMLGTNLRRVMHDFPNQKLLVLCGHTHSPGIFIDGNIKVLTGVSEYGAPRVQRIINEETFDF